MTLGRVAILMGCALGVVAAGVVITVLYMVLYGHMINPGAAGGLLASWRVA